MLIIWIIYNLAVLLKTGFMSDDAYNSQVKGQILEQGVSLNDRILSEAMGWLKGAGRLMILTWYMTYGLYYFTQDPIIVKTINIIIVISGILLFYIFSKKETGSSYLALLACLLVPAFFQFRIWHDPIMAFTFLIPLIFMLTMGALVFFQKFLDSGKIHYCVIAVCAYLMTLLMYEISYVLCLLFVVVAYARNRSIAGTIRQTLPFTAVTTLLIGVVAFFRLYFIKNSGNPLSTYPGAEFHINLGNVISAFQVQTFSSVPLSYFFFNKENLELIFRRADYIVLATFGVALSILLYKIGRNLTPLRLGSWMSCGVILLFAPAALTSLSGHQLELIAVGYGFGYIPVYLQYFGLCIIVVAVISITAIKIKWHLALAALSIVVSGALTVVAGLNLGLNRAVALKMNEAYKYPAALLKAALLAGLTDDVKDGAFIFRTARYASDHTWFYRINTGKKVELCELSDAVKYKSCIEKMRLQQGVVSGMPSGSGIEIVDLRKQDAWILSYNFEKRSGKTGQVTIGKIERIIQNANSKTLIQVNVNKIKVYSLKRNQIQVFDFESSPIDFLKIVDNQTVDMAGIQPLNVDALRATDVASEWLGSVHGREGTDDKNLRWSSGNAILTLHNMSDKPRLVTLTMELGTPTAGSSQMTVKYPSQTDTLTLGRTPVSYVKRILMAPGTTQITFTSNAEPIRNGDPRNIVFGIFDFKLQSAEVDAKK